MAWQLQRDLVSLAGLRLRLHRIGRAHWRADTRLRSWGVAPLHRGAHGLHAPCGDDEALWLGAWLDEDAGAAAIELHEPQTGWAASIALPQQFQITSLRDGAGRQGAIAPPLGTGRRALQLALHQGRAQCDIALVLHAPADWAALAGRAAPATLAPPPLPPRLG